MAVLTQELLLHAICNSFAKLIEVMELWKRDDATRDFWSRLAKALQQSNVQVTWAEQLDSRLASVHAIGKMSWAAATRSVRECKMRIERIGGSRLDTDSEVWGLDQTLICSRGRVWINILYKNKHSVEICVNCQPPCQAPAACVVKLKRFAPKCAMTLVWIAQTRMCAC